MKQATPTLPIEIDLYYIDKWQEINAKRIAKGEPELDTTSAVNYAFKDFIIEMMVLYEQGEQGNEQSQ